MLHPVGVSTVDSDPDRRTQLLHGSLDICVLALVSQRPGHAYELTARLSRAGLGEVAYGTVYPLITRLDRLGLLDHDVEASPAGPPRRVYRPSEAGIASLHRWAEQWRATTDAVTDLLDQAAIPTATGKVSL